MKNKALILGVFFIMSVFTGAANMVKVVYGGHIGQSKEDIIKFKDIYTDKKEKENLLKSGRVFYLPAETVLEKKQEIYGYYEEFMYEGKSVYAVNLSTQNAQDN